MPLSVLAAAVTLATAGCDGEDFSGPAAGSGGSSGSSGSGGAGGAEEPDNVGGDYLVSLTYGANTCPGDGTWVEGNQTTGIPFTIQQDGTRIWAAADGVAAVLFLLVTGEVDFEGEIHGDRFSMTDYGSKATQSGNCTYTVNAVIEGTVTGNTIEGTVTYTPAITDNPDCDALKCQAQQFYSGSRPPPA